MSQPECTTNIDSLNNPNVCCPSSPGKILPMLRKPSFLGFTFATMLLIMLAVRASASSPKETVIHSFGGGSYDGANPYAALVADNAGNLYGTTAEGGTHGAGTVFELEHHSNGTWTQTILYNFTEGGYGPFNAGLILDSKGDLYGAYSGGGAYRCGFVYKLSRANSGWTFSVLHNFRFDGTTYFDGSYPFGGVIRDRKGNLYGTTQQGGTGPCYDPFARAATAPPRQIPPDGCGTVFELSPSSNGKWREKVLYSFQGEADGGNPYADLTLNASGDLFGTAAGGGDLQECTTDFGGGCGVVFELTRVGGGAWTESALYAFTNGTDGAYPSAGVIFDKAGNLYGTTEGFSKGGSVFELSPNSNGTWNETTLASFQNVTYGFSPSGSLLLDGAGNLYGTTRSGSGPAANLASLRTALPHAGWDWGTIFELSPGQGGTWTTDWLYSFTGGADGSEPASALIRGPGGALYGTTIYGGTGYGTVFKFVP